MLAPFGQMKPCAEDVVGVAADLDDVVAFDLDRESARRLAERAGREPGDALLRHREAIFADAGFTS